MAKTREERKPECHFELVGEDTDIEALKRWVHLAGCEIFSEQGRPVLKGNTLDELDDFDEARSQASDIVAVASTN